MSDINLDFTVSNNSINFTVEPNDITITPTDILLTINPSIIPGAGGNIGELQYNNGSLLAGIPTATYTSGNLALGNVANLKITGGVNGYVLQTDGTGNLDWTAMTGNGGGNGTPGGSNTQIQYNDGGSFGGNTGFTFNEVTGNVAIPGNLSVVGNIAGNVQNAYLANFATLANAVAGANVSGQVPYAAIANSVAGANVSGQVPYAAIANSVSVANVSGIGNIATVNLTGSTSNVLYGNGVFAAIGNVGSSNFANFAGNVTVSSQPNITSLGDLVDLRIANSKIHLGTSAGSNGQGSFTVAVGYEAGRNNQSAGGVAIGSSAGQITQGNSAVAIGDLAGQYIQGNASIAIGKNSGQNNQGNFSIAIGANAGGNVFTSQPNNSIILNATGVVLNAPFANTFVVKPIRSATQGNILYYDSTSGEITFDTNSGNGGGSAAGANTQVQFNTANVLDGSPNFTFNTSSNTLSVTGTITSTANIDANNLNSSNVVSATGNVIGGNLVATNRFIKSAVTNIGSIGSAGVAGTGARAMVSDSASTTFRALYSGGGSIIVPVFSDGSNWRIG